MVKTGIKQVMWKLQIPLENVICFVDGLVWNRILGIRCGVGNTLRWKWADEAIEKCPDHSRSYFKKCKDDFWNQKPKTGSWWDDLFVQEAGENVSAIIYQPVQEKSVKKQTLWYCR